MADLLSDEAAFGGVAAEPSWTEKAKNFVGMGEKKAPPKGLLSDADVFGGEALEQSFRDAAKPSALIGRGLKDTGERLGKGVAAAADMFLGIPGQALAVGANLGARGAAFVAGESRKVQGLAGEEAEQLIPEGLKTPIQTFIKTLGGGEALDQSIVTNQIESFANHLEKITGGKTTAEDVKAYINTFMMAGGAKVGDVGVAAGIKKLQSLEKSKPLVREEPPAAVVDEAPITDVEASVAPDVGKIFKDAKKNRPSPEAQGAAEVNALFEQAKKRGMAPSEAAQQAVAESQARIAERAAAGPKPRNEIPIVGETPAALVSGLDKIKNGEAATMTAAEKIYVRDHLRKEAEKANGPDRIQKGAIDPELLKHMGYAAGGAAAATLGKALWNWYNEQNTVQVDDLFKKPPAKWSPYDPAGPDEDMQEPAPMRNGNYWTGLGGAGALAAAVGAMKIKGEPASWHPRVLEELSTVLKSNAEALEGARGIEATSDRNVHAERMIQKHLNKHMATEGDPLADVQIPYGEGTKRWGDVVNEGTNVRPASRYKGHDVMQNEDFETHSAYNPDLIRVSPKFKSIEEARDWAIVNRPTDFDKVPHNEKVFGLGLDTPKQTSAVRALTSYLSHVGDYLREHVSPEKLQSYDLVRAVKETVKWDAELAKKMNDARLNDMKDATVYKAYPKEGMAWVELNKPGQFARESDAMGHSVRGYEPPKPPDVSLDPMNWYFDRKGTEGGFDAEAAARAGWRQATPEARARFKTEVMESAAYKEYVRRINAAKPKTDWVEASGDSGHPSYGHGGWEAIKRGDAKVLSLRDLKTGESHATVEIHAPAGQPITSGPKPIFGDRGRTPLDTPASISQIKGKQNRAPSEKYLPFIQDLVKSGKWGEVGDLGNTGLTKVRGKFMSNADIAERAGVDTNIADAYMMGRIAPGEPGYINLAEFLTKGTERPRSQQGSADPRLLATIAAAGGVAAYLAANPDQQETLAAAGILGMAGRFKGLRESISTVGHGLDYALGAASTRIGNISPALKLRAREFERNVLEKKEAALQQVHPFLDAIKKVPEGSPLDLALLRNEGVEALLPAEARPAWRAVQKVLGEFEKVHHDLGRFKEGLTNYFPRIVTDLEGLKKALGTEQRTKLEENLLRAEAKMVKEQQRGLTDVERSLIVNHSLTADVTMKNDPGYIHGRRVEDLTAQLRPFYESPTNSLLRYISSAITDIEMARFFGKDVATSKVGSKTVTNVDNSIGNIVAQEIKAGRVHHEQANELRALLKSRFEGGERSMGAPLQDARNLTNIALLGQFGSAAVQIGDSLMTNYHHGMLPTLKALKQKLTGDSQVTSKEFGLVNHIAEELGSNRHTGKALQTVFKANGFAMIDQFAKGLNLNAGLIKNQKLASTQAGRARLAAKYAEAFGPAFPKLLEDLQARRITPEVKSLLFSELSDAQPLTKMEMPQGYLDHPNGRLLYQMKTYMLKQMDVIRRDAYQEIAKGHYVTGAKNLMAVSAALALSGIPGEIIKDWLSGRDAGLDKIDYAEALLKNFGISRYSLDQVGSGKPLEVVRDMVLPPYKHFQEMLNATTSFKEDNPLKAEKQQNKVIKYVPLVGRPFYDRELGGNAVRESMERIKAKRELRDAAEAANPALRDARLARQARAEAKKLAK